MKSFDKDFLLGAATAAHQVEGNNKNSDCWVLENLPHSMYTEPSLDAVDHYHRYEEDIALLAKAGLNSYRFSIEWARIEPEPGAWDQREIEHYRDMLACCQRYGIVPVVTMHHFSSPRWLVSQGGWESPLAVEAFARYCGRVARELGGSMGIVCTINEANMRLQLSSLMKEMTARMAASRGGGNPGRPGGAESSIQVGINALPESYALGMKEAAEAFGVADPSGVHNFVSQCGAEGDAIVMKAHAAARAAMKAECPHLKIGLSLSLHDMQPGPGGEAHAEREWEDELTHYLPSIEGDDFLGVQCYTRKRFDAHGPAGPLAGERRTQMGYEDYPLAIANVLRKVASSFKGDLIVTENGIATGDDERRVEFMREALDGIQACIADGLPVKGYYYWSLLDNFEWQRGYSMTFGLVAVDRKTQTRLPKRSLGFLGSWLK